jgi:hypothetical protein
MGLGKKLKKAFNKINKSGLGGIPGLVMRATDTDFGARDMQRREDKSAAIRAYTEAELKAKKEEEARIFAENETNKAVKAEQDRKQTLFGGEIEQQLREKKELLEESEDPEEIARKEFLRRKLLGI